MTTQGALTMRAILLLAITLISLAPPLAVADTDAERAALAKVLHEIEMLQALITEAEAAADPDARIRFQYSWLRADLATIRQGIDAHLQAPRQEPRTWPVLRGDYRR
ncbi:MAG: RAQPRD family integrative conjugative element protein [Woeseia sp.]